jgi:hypothetical protein
LSLILKYLNFSVDFLYLSSSNWEFFLSSLPCP